MNRLTAAGGVLFREGDHDKAVEVLLIYRRGVWDLPKGKMEQGESVEECARREVAEEVGSRLPQLHSRLEDTYHEYVEDGQEIGKTTHWYAMSISTDGANLKPEREEGIEKLEWVPLDEATKKVGYDNLRLVLQSFSNWKSQMK